MKKLYLTRHAKSSWKDQDLDDFDRPLNKRGRRDAPFIGQKLKEKNILPGLIISSPAKRAITTAKVLAKQMGYPKDAIVEDENIYEAGGGELLSIIQQVDDKYSSLMMVGHNPAFTSLHNYLADQYIDNIPTCSVAFIDLAVDNWKEVEPNTGTLIDFEYPKKYFKS
jgi:phosphohistidine phosphatase